MKLCCLGLLLATPVLAANVSLENDTMRIEWNDRGQIASLLHKPTQRQFVPAQSPWPLYTVQPVDVAPINSTDAAKITVAEQQGLIIIQSEHAQPALTVTCTFHLDKEASVLLGGFSLSSPADIRLSSVRFGIASTTVPMSGDGATDRIVLPNCDGQLQRDLSKNRFERSLAYPGVASMQMLAAYDKTAGVYLAARDSAGNTKQLIAKSDLKSATLSIVHLTDQSARKEWRLPYEIAITTFSTGHTGWETAADLYAAWARKQPWCAKTLAQRMAAKAVPDWLAQPSLFYAFSMQGQLKDGKTGDRLGLIADHAKAWREITSAPVTMMLMSWEKNGAWVTPDYFPPRGGDDGFSNLTRTLRQRGDRSLVFLSGLNWTLQKERDGKTYDSQAEFDNRARKFAISDPKGEAIITGKPDADVGRYARICSSTPLAHEILVGSSLRCQQLGIDCVQADQIVGGGQPPCFHPQHNHPPGGGAWCAKALYDLFENIRKDGKSKDPHFAFSIEEPAEFFIPVLDTYHARDYMQGRWPRYGAATEGIPLFTHVYHDYLHGYGGDSCLVTNTPSTSALYQQGMNLVCGKAPAVAVWTRWLEPSAVHPTQQRLLRAHMDLWRGPARDYLIFGRRISATPLDVPTTDITFGDSKANTKQALAIPKVLDAVWQRPDGRKARFYVNITLDPITFLLNGKQITLAPGQPGFTEFP